MIDTRQISEIRKEGKIEKWKKKGEIGKVERLGKRGKLGKAEQIEKKGKIDKLGKYEEKGEEVRMSVSKDGVQRRRIKIRRAKGPKA